VPVSLPHIRGRYLIFIDIAAVAASVALTVLLFLTAGPSSADAVPAAWIIAIPIVTRPFLNLGFGLYRRLWRHASVQELLQITMAVVAGSLVSVMLAGLLDATVGGATLSGASTFWVLEGLLSLTALGGVRFAIRLAAEGRSVSAHAEDGIPTILYGAGVGGVMVVRSARDPRSRIRPVGFLDDDRRLHGNVVAGLTVHGGLAELEKLAARKDARRLLITTTNASGKAMRRIVREAMRVGLEVRTVPRLHELFDGTVDAQHIRRVRVDDLLHRPAIAEHVAGVTELVAGRVILITGAGGSIGSELARQVFAMRPDRLILVDRAEGPLYGIQRELEVMAKRHLGAGALSVHIANVATRATMRRLVRTGRPDIIFHAAAYKHVPMMEEHPSDAVHVNIGGTLSVLEAAEAFDVPHLVFVSTDKAVRPTSVMGATKRVAEGLISEAAARTGHRYVSVRFGNVLGSSGSVVPIFQQQLEKGEPLTITHPEMTRYFMTIREAVWLILDATAIGSPGSLLVLDMGEPVKIVDLAQDLIRLAGRHPDTVPIEFTGLRPGEKLHEELFYAAEQVEPTMSEKVMLAAPQPPLLDIRERAAELIAMAGGDSDEELRLTLFGITDLLERRAATPARQARRRPVLRPTAQLGTRR
jgi:FlaA1/EpsC-like NDP-sugar epimerase